MEGQQIEDQGRKGGQPRKGQPWWGKQVEGQWRDEQGAGGRMQAGLGSSPVRRRARQRIGKGAFWLRCSRHFRPTRCVPRIQ